MSCLDMSPVSNVDSKDEKSEFVAVGLWTDISARILKLPNLEELCREQLGGGQLFCINILNCMKSVVS